MPRKSTRESEDENRDEEIAGVLGQIQMGNTDEARDQSRKGGDPTVFNEALKQAKMLGWVDDSVPEEPLGEDTEEDEEEPETDES